MSKSVLEAESSFGNFTAFVNGKHTECPQAPERSIYRPMGSKSNIAAAGQILARVERRLAALGLTASKASREAGKPDAIRNLQRAVKGEIKSGPTVETIVALAPVLKTTAAWLISETGRETPEEIAVPILGKAGDGGYVHHLHDRSDPIGSLVLPEWIIPRSTTVAIEIDGDSLGSTYNGWHALYDETRGPPTVDLLGHLCVVKTAVGQVYIKKLAKGRAKRFTLMSDFAPPLYDIEVKWAAKVKNMVPR